MEQLIHIIWGVMLLEISCLEGQTLDFQVMKPLALDTTEECIHRLQVSILTIIQKRILVIFYFRVFMMLHTKDHLII
jgi:hypothetical protein